MKKRLLSAFLAACLAVTCIPCAVFAETEAPISNDESVNEEVEYDGRYVTGSIITPEPVELTEEEAAELEKIRASYENSVSEEDGLVSDVVYKESSASIEKCLSNDYSDNYFYKQLNAAEKKLYDSIYDVAYEAALSGINYSATNVGNNLNVGYVDKVNYSGCSVSRACDIYKMMYTENPQFFYLAYYVPKYDNSDIYIYTWGDFNNGANRKNAVSTIAEKTEDILADIDSMPFPTVMEQEQAIYRYIVENVCYDYDALDNMNAGDYSDNPYSQTIAGPFLKGTTVCAGYASTFTYLCNFVGIETIQVEKPGVHQWNMVYLYGNWYVIDTTWIDMEEAGYNYDYCNMSESYIDAKDAESEKNATVHNYKKLTGFNYPTCTKNSYKIHIETADKNGYFYTNLDNFTKGWYIYTDNAHVWNDYFEYDYYVEGAEVSATAYEENGYTFLGWDMYKWNSSTSQWDFHFTVSDPAFVIDMEDNNMRAVASFGTAGSTKPANVKATGGANKVTLTWDAVPGATKYAVSTYSNGKYNIHTLNCTSTSYTVTGLAAGTTYQFLVQAYVNGKWSTFTKADHVSATTTGSSKPTNVKATGGANKVTLTWNAVSGATKYAVSTYSGGKYTIHTLDCTGTSYTVTGLAANTTYQFLVQAYVNGKWSTFSTADHVLATTTGSASSNKPTNVRATADETNVLLTWDEVAGATKYAVSMYYSGSYIILTTDCISPSCYVTELSPATTYQFLVQAYVNGKWSAFTTADNISVTTADSSSSNKPTNILISVGTNQATLTWSAVPNATKYAVSYYKDGKYNILTLDCPTTSYTAKGLTSCTTYEFLVQAYVGGKWSTFTTADHVSVTTR